MNDRTTYAVEENLKDRGEAEEACQLVLELLRPMLRVALIDAYSDYSDEMPPHVVEAELWLRQLGGSQSRRDPGMGVEVPLDDDGWEVLRVYAPWSINVELLGDNRSHLGTFHDCGYSITAHLTTTEAAVLRDRLAPTSALVPLSELREQRREAKRDQRRRRFRFLRGWRSDA